MYYDPYGNNRQVKAYPDTITTPSGGAGGGTGGGEFNFDDFASSSESNSQSTAYGGPSDWSKEWTQNFLDRFQPGLDSTYKDWKNLSDQSESPVGTLNAKQISDLLANLMNTRGQTENDYNNMNKNATIGGIQMRGQTGSDYTKMRGDNTTNTQGMREWIEQARKLMPQQYAEEMNLYNERATQPVLNRMSGRGILNSSVTGGALSDVLRDTQAKQSDLVTQSNLWSANKNYDLDQYLNDRSFDINKMETGQNYDTNKYLNDRTFDINKLRTGQNYDTNKLQIGATNDANILSGNRLLDIQKQKRDSILGREKLYAGMIPSLLNALRTQTSQSTSQGSSFGGLMELLMASQGG